MNQNEKRDDLLDRSIDAVRDQTIDPAIEQTAAARAWTRIAAAAVPHTIRSCAEFQALMPDYREGKLPEPRALLLKDHVNACVACRKALKAAPIPVRHDIAPSPRRTAHFRPYAVAASILLTAGVAGWFGYDRLTTPAGARAVVQSVEGKLYNLTPGGPRLINAGAELNERDMIHTAASARAVLRLRDGSLVEMNERAGLSVSMRRRDTTIHLDGGSIIVEAAKRRTGHLYVSGQDYRVAVTGTVFSVNQGTKGSRVSVIEGEVHVDEGSNRHVLRPGDQVSTNAAMGKASIADEIAWSRDFSRHMSLLKELGDLTTKLQAVRLPGLRYSSRLLQLAPADTLAVAGLPNLGQAAGEAYRIFQDQLQSSPVLREWYEENKTQAGEPSLDDLIAKIQEVSGFLGDEVLVLVRHQGPVVLAEVTKPGLEQALGKLFTGTPFYVGANAVAIAPDQSQLREIAANINRGSGGFSTSALHARIAEIYRGGAGFYVAADAESLLRSEPRELQNATAAGFGNVRYLVLEQKSLDGSSGNRAVLSFAGQRAGVASWLGAPGPMRTLEYVSADAHAAASFIVKSPAEMLGDFLRVVNGAIVGLDEIQRETGLRLREDIAAALGAEITFALDGPLLPTPSWKLVAEVYQPGLLQQSLERLVQGINSHEQLDPRSRLVLTQEAASGRLFYRVQAPAIGQEIHYTYDGGYFVAGPSRGLVEQALSHRQSGAALPRSARFQSLIPRDGHANFSGVVYSNVGAAVAPFAAVLGGAQGLTQEQQLAARSLAEGSQAMLVCLYGGQDSIVASSRASLLDLPLFGVAGPGTLLRMLDREHSGRKPRTLSINP